MRFFQKFQSIFLTLALLLSVLIPGLALAADTIEIEVVVRGADTIGVQDANVYIYVYNETTETYEEYAGPFVSNSAGRTKIDIPVGVTFYAKATDIEDNVYADSNFEWPNIWTSTATSIINPDTGSERTTKYVHIYPGLYEAIEETPAESVPDDHGTGLIIDYKDFSEALADADNFELEVTVYDEHRDPISNAEVTLYSGEVIYSTDTTGDSGRTDEIIAPMGFSFYATATDIDGNVYGGTYDYYFDRENYWTSDDGETIANIATGLTRLPYLHLFPTEFLPSDYTGEATDFDPETYTCAGFSDAIYADLSAEECEAIEFVHTKGVFTGTSEGLLELDREINRAEATKVLVELFDVPEVSIDGSRTEFPDVGPSTDWYGTYVYQAYYNGVVHGYDDGLFRPTNTVNRAELLKIFIEASGLDYSSVSRDYTFWHDVEITADGPWFISYANYAFDNDLLEHDGNLEPDKAMTRRDVIKLIYRYAGL